MVERTDIVLINPGDRKQVYQGLGQDFSAIEPPFWIAVLAAFLRNKGFKVAVLDANAENITPIDTAKRIAQINPLLALVEVYGSQPSASTQNMTIAGKIIQELKRGAVCKVVLGGLHPSSLPRRTIEEEKVDFLIEGEGFYTLVELLKALKSKSSDYSNVPGLWYFLDGKIKNNPRAPLVENLD